MKRAYLKLKSGKIASVDPAYLDRDPQAAIPIEVLVGLCLQQQLVWRGDIMLVYPPDFAELAEEIVARALARER